MKSYDQRECWKKADQHWELAGLARQDRDPDDERKNTDLARMWEKRAREGGYVEGQT